MLAAPALFNAQCVFGTFSNAAGGNPMGKTSIDNRCERNHVLSMRVLTLFRNRKLSFLFPLRGRRRSRPARKPVSQPASQPGSQSCLGAREQKGRGSRRSAFSKRIAWGPPGARQGVAWGPPGFEGRLFDVFLREKNDQETDNIDFS